MQANLEGRSILVVDDDPDVLTTVRMAFSSAGAKVATANNGNAAVDMVKQVNPDLVVLDIMMPKQSGFLVMEKIKPDHVIETRPYVIMITSNEGKRHERYARHLGVADYMTKPFSLDRLVEKACELLGGEIIDPDA